MDDGERGALIIERATVTDAVEILALQRLAFQREAQRYREPALPPLRQTLAELMAEFETHVILKVIVKGRIVGSVRAYAETGTCYIGRLMVHPRLQRQGIGRALMHQIEARFPDAQRFQLSTGAQSTENIRLYDRLGYRIVATKLVTNRVSVVVMIKVARPPCPDHNYGASPASDPSYDVGAPT